MEDELKPARPRTKPEKTKVLMAFNVYPDVHAQFRQLAFQQQMSISELLRKSLSDYEDICFTEDFIGSISAPRGETKGLTVTTTVNISPKDKEKLEAIARRHRLNLTAVVRGLMKQTVVDNEDKIQEEIVTKPETKKRLDLELPLDAYTVLHAYALNMQTNLSEFIRLNFEKFSVDDYKLFADDVLDAKKTKNLYRTSISIYPKLITSIDEMVRGLNEEHGDIKRIRKVKSSDIIGAFMYFAQKHLVPTNKM
jgi:hypothetical protein